MPEPDGEQSRLDRELIELLNEMRVALPGVQVLFAFLLTLPFTQRFGDLSQADQRVYVFALLASVVSITLLIAPAAHHRLTFRQHAKEGVIQLANVLVLLGTAALALAVGAAVYLAMSMVTGADTAARVAGLLTGVAVLLWFAVPVVVLRRTGDDAEDEANGPVAKRSPSYKAQTT